MGSSRTTLQYFAVMIFSSHRELGTLNLLKNLQASSLEEGGRYKMGKFELKNLVLRCFLQDITEGIGFRYEKEDG